MRRRTIDRVDRRSKYLLFDAGDAALLVHLGIAIAIRQTRQGGCSSFDCVNGNAAGRPVSRRNRLSLCGR
jgi:formamidopyrimidine-DNA glycosylase